MPTLLASRIIDKITGTTISVLLLAFIQLSSSQGIHRRLSSAADFEKSAEPFLEQFLEFNEKYIDGKKDYRLEDFFWTGSGDGNDEHTYESQNSVTIYKTKTVLSTVYVDSPSTHDHQTLPDDDSPTSTTSCPINCDTTTQIIDEISPTQTLKPYPFNDTDSELYDADRHFWLLTVLKSDGKDPVILDLRNSLAKLYKTAFQRQQELHLGIKGRTKRQANDEDKPVNVVIHNVKKTIPSDENGAEHIQVLYHVAVSGQPVAATTAAADMHLVTDEEVTTELGYPFLIKAEPYLKASEPQYLVSSNNTWIFIGVSLTILFVLLSLVALLTLILSKRGVKSDNIKDMHINGSQHSQDLEITKQLPKSSTYVDFKTHQQLPIARPHQSSSSVASSSSTLSASSIDISPLMGLRKTKSPVSKKISISRPKAATNKTAPMHLHQQSHHHYRRRKKRTSSSEIESDSSVSKVSRKEDTVDKKRRNQDSVISPKSYLSMPSVKSFPRINNVPEPLNKVLEPVSVLHLDITDDETLEQEKQQQGIITRQASMSAIEDPGVINPAIWDAHARRMRQEITSEDATDETDIRNVSHMRKRFHNLLDETFSLFGSQKDGSTDGRSTDIEGLEAGMKSRSAVLGRQNRDDKSPHIRPKTSAGARREQQLTAQTRANGQRPRGAWATNDGTPLSRSLSAGSFRRPLTAATVDVDRILADGTLSPNDTAVPLITAIKAELNRCSLPGSTNNLNEHP